MGILAPPAQEIAVIRSLLCRAALFSSDVDGRRQAFLEVIVALILRAGFPPHRVREEALRWSHTWGGGAYAEALQWALTRRQG